MAEKPSTSERLEMTVLVNLDEKAREQLAKDIEAEFDAADAADDTKAMDEAHAKLVRLDMFEEMVAEVDDAIPAEDETPAEEESAPSAKAETETETDKSESDKVDKVDTSETAKDTDTPAEDVTDEAPAAEADAESTDTAPADSGEKTPDEAKELAMAASAVTPASTDDAVRPSVTTNPVVPVTASAGPGLRDYRTGEKFGNMDDIAVQMTERLAEIQHATGDGTRAIVASLRANFSDARNLTNKDSLVNQEKIDAVTGEHAIVASGGYCAPLPVNYDIFGVGSSVRPVRDALPTFGAPRGGIRYISPPVLGSYTGAIALWTAINDQNPTAPATKPVLKVNCASELSATADAIPLTLEFGNLMTRAFPELVQRHNQLALIEHARFAEKTLLSKISALSNKVTVTRQLGSVRDVLSAIARASAAYRNRHRIPRGVQLRGLFPDWVRDQMREDLATNMRMGAQDIAVTDGQIDAWFASRGIRASFHMDDTFSAQTANAELNDWPSSIKFWLFAEGTLIFLDGGTLDIGVVRDADLVSTNDYSVFMETFEGVAKVGIEVLQVTAATGTGPAPAPVTP